MLGFIVTEINGAGRENLCFLKTQKLNIFCIRSSSARTIKGKNSCEMLKCDKSTLKSSAIDRKGDSDWFSATDRVSLPRTEFWSLVLPVNTSRATKQISREDAELLPCKYPNWLRFKLYHVQTVELQQKYRRLLRMTPL